MEQVLIDRGRTRILRREVQHISAVGKNGEERNARWEFAGVSAVSAAPWIRHRNKGFNNTIMLQN